MKKVVFGGILTLAGVMLIGIIYIPTSIQCMNLDSWMTHRKFISAMKELGLTFPYYLSIVLLIVGIVIGLIGCFENSIRKLINLQNNKQKD
ncbi:hypothetical protein [Vallitalea maricola]|uniref:Uncharacterized protein n=1 Tax=Vallitalea maricola TaxID=3074433 RepID=A0ACB5UGU6_9FIRM|nr:hypothetical protein AN2V17_13180 [Vallitalea sp. AN17-2]